MTLHSRLALGLVTIAIILVGPLAFAVKSLHGLQRESAELRDRDFGGSLALGRLRDGLSEIRRLDLALLFSKDVQTRDAMDRQIARVAALADSLRNFELPVYANAIGASVQQIADVAPSEYRAALANDTTTADSLSLHRLVPAVAHADSTVATAEHGPQN